MSDADYETVTSEPVRHGSPAAPHLVPHGETRCRVCGKNVMLETFTKPQAQR